MKIIIPKQIVCPESLDRLKKPLNLYGLLREDEGITFISSVHKSMPRFPSIGQIRADGYKTKGLKIIGQTKGNLAFQYYNGSSWEPAEHCFVDLSDTYKRGPFLKTHLDILNKSRVAIFGVGSGGSGLLDRLVRAGVTGFDLIDPDRLSIENISRHLCDLSDLGRYKVNAVKDRILMVNPFANVRTYHYDVFKKHEVLFHIISRANLVIGATDEPSTQLKLNWHRTELH